MNLIAAAALIVFSGLCALPLRWLTAKTWVQVLLMVWATIILQGVVIAFIYPSVVEAGIEYWQWIIVLSAIAAFSEETVRNFTLRLSKPTPISIGIVWSSSELLSYAIPVALSGFLGTAEFLTAFLFQRFPAFCLHLLAAIIQSAFRLNVFGTTIAILVHFAFNIYIILFVFQNTG